MKRLTAAEIQFVKDTHFTPTVYQCNEYHRTPFKNYAEAYAAAKERGIDLDEFIDKNLSADLDDSDAISLENTAVYLLYSFFTKPELEQLTDKQATKFLQDYRYFLGFRKWDRGNLFYVYEAIGVYNGEYEFYTLDDGNVWYRKRI